MVQNKTIIEWATRHDIRLLLTDARAAYEDAASGDVNDWIPIEKQLPKVREGMSEFVLVTTNEGHIEFARYLKRQKYWATPDMRHVTVTAWMPIPEPYKKQGAE